MREMKEPGRAMTPLYRLWETGRQDEKGLGQEYSPEKRWPGWHGFLWAISGVLHRKGKGLSSLGHLVAGWEPPVGSMTLAQRQRWLSEHRSQRWQPRTLLQ